MYSGRYAGRFAPFRLERFRVLASPPLMMCLRCLCDLLRRARHSQISPHSAAPGLQSSLLSPSARTPSSKQRPTGRTQLTKLSRIIPSPCRSPDSCSAPSLDRAVHGGYSFRVTEIFRASPPADAIAISPVALLRMLLNFSPHSTSTSASGVNSSSSPSVSSCRSPSSLYTSR